MFCLLIGKDLLRFLSWFSVFPYLFLSLFKINLLCQKFVDFME